LLRGELIVLTPEWHNELLNVPVGVYRIPRFDLRKLKKEILALKIKRKDEPEPDLVHEVLPDRPAQARRVENDADDLEPFHKVHLARDPREQWALSLALVDLSFIKPVVEPLEHRRLVPGHVLQVYARVRRKRTPHKFLTVPLEPEDLIVHRKQVGLGQCVIKRLQLVVYKIYIRYVLVVIVYYYLDSPRDVKRTLGEKRWLILVVPRLIICCKIRTVDTYYVLLTEARTVVPIFVRRLCVV
jgi:hypothetical protein